MFDEFSNTVEDKENQNLENVSDDENFAEADEGQKNLKFRIGGKDIIQLKSNFIPKGLIPLEKLLDQNDVDKNPAVQPNEDDIQDHNIGTEEHPSIIKLLKKFTTNQKEKYIGLMKNFSNVFAWIYEDLKEYDTSIIQHIIPVKP